jgi:Zn-dependent protease with chaperone function
VTRTSPDLQKFEEAVGRSYGQVVNLVTTSTRERQRSAPSSPAPWKVLGLRLFPVAVFFGVGVLLRNFVGPALPIAITICVLACALRMRFTDKQLGPVDWDTAGPYWETTRLQLSDEANDVITTVTAATLARRKKIIAVHPYLVPCPEGVDDGSCAHHPCMNAGAVWLGRRRVMAIGRRVANMPPPAFEAILRHELRHSTGIMAPYAVMQVTLQTFGWMIAACAPVSALIAVPAWWATTGAVAWANELIADATAVRAAGLDADLAALRVSRVKMRGVPWKHRLLPYLIVVLFPTHPPIRLRIAVAHAVAHAVALLPRPHPRPSQG